MTITQGILQKNIKLLRCACGASQEKVAGVMHLARTTYCAYETGVKQLDLQSIDAIARLYDISFDSLVNYDLSEGLLNRVYFSEENGELAELLNAYQSLSVSSKILIAQRLNMIMEKEELLYAEPSGNINGKKK